MAGQNISHEGHRQRMRTRVEQYGLESLAPHEVLEYLLYITNARHTAQLFFTGLQHPGKAAEPLQQRVGEAGPGRQLERGAGGQ